MVIKFIKSTTGTVLANVVIIILTIILYYLTISYCLLGKLITAVVYLGKGTKCAAMGK